MERYENAEGTAQETIRAGMNDIANKGREAANRLTDALTTARQRIQDSTIAGAKATDRAIREHPYESIGIAFGLGILIGVLINRR